MLVHKEYMRCMYYILHFSIKLNCLQTCYVIKTSTGCQDTALAAMFMFSYETAKNKTMKLVTACKRMCWKPVTCVDLIKQEDTAFHNLLMVEKKQPQMPPLIRCYHIPEKRRTFHN